MTRGEGLAPCVSSNLGSFDDSVMRIPPYLQAQVLHLAFNCRVRSPCKHGLQQRRLWLWREPTLLSSKPKPLHKRHQALFQPVALGAVVDKANMATVVAHLQGHRRAQFFLAR